MIEWCSDGPGKLNEEYIAAFLAQYEKNRQLTATEKAMLWKYAMFIGLWY
jgi:Ser/Thr protein kinase RdoA (MazF antagonist)